MALLKFNYGLLENLPAYNADTTVGNVYITKDSHEMKVDLPSADGGRITISDFVIVENETALTALGTYYENLFYYVKDTNQLKRYVAAQGDAFQALRCESCRPTWAWALCRLYGA